MKRKAVALYSGGLDSTLAIKLVQNQGIDVLALHFYTGFCITETKRRRGEKKEDGSHYMNPALKYAAKYGFPLEIVDISDGYMDVILNPKYGYGANINPCIDCRIYMFKKAKEIMQEVGADFVISGEVLGQRPKSQKSIPLKIIEKEAGLEGLILRPLSAKYKETMAVEGKITQEDLVLFTVGRHFRLDSGTKLIVSRNEGENNFLLGFKKSYHFFEPLGKGPVAIAKTINGEILDEDDKQIIANIIARYSKTIDGKIDVKYSFMDREEILTGFPFDDETINQWRVSLNGNKSRHSP
jgi:hypothetical protein